MVQEIILEPVNASEPVEEEAADPTPEQVEAEPVEETVADTAPVEAEEEPVVPAPKRRGRPPGKAKTAAAPPPPKAKKAPAPKATAPKPRTKKPPPPPESDSSSSEDEVERNLYEHVSRPSLETAVLEFLVNKRASESARRRELWARMAQF